MRYVLTGLTALLLCSCIGPFSGRKPPPLSGPLPLQVHFDSSRAAAVLRWGRASVSGFSHYQVQRATGRSFVTIREIRGVEDTSFVDTRLLSVDTYRYRVICRYVPEEEPMQSLASTSVEGCIHCFVNTWNLPADRGDFRPTRLVVSDGGVVSVVGVGSSRVERFDRAGNPLGSWEYASGPLASLETGVLDGPSLVVDGQGNLYVAYNVLREGGAPRAQWTKFDREGRRVWTRPLAGTFARHIAIDRAGRLFIESISQLQQFDSGGERLARFTVPPLLVSSLRFWKDDFAALIEPLQLVEGGWQAPRLVVYQGAKRDAPEIVIGRDPLSPEDHGNGLLRRPTDFAVDETHARAFVVNAGENRIEVFQGGAYLTRWGEEGEAPGQFRLAGRVSVVDDMNTGTTAVRRVVAGGIARDREGYLYVADTFNNRIQKFQP